MTPLTHLSSAAASALLSAIWQGTVLAAVVALVLRLLPAIPAAIRSAIWTAVFVIVLGLHFVPATQGANAGAGHVVHLASGWSIALAGIWLCFSLFRAAEFTLSAARLAQIARRATPIDLPLVPAGSRSYKICTSPDVDRPSVLGFWSPRILLPAGLLEALTPAELEQVLLHETEHLRRSDDWTNLVQKLALVVFPLNPVLFWVERRLCLERELACDDRVLAGCATRKSYATCLTRIAEHGIFRRGMALALGAFGKKSELATRVHRILRQPARTMSRAASGFTAAALLTGVTAGSLTLAHSPRLISFAPAVTPMVAAAGVPEASAVQHSGDGSKAMLVKAIVPATQPVQMVKAKQHRRRSTVPGQPRMIDTAMRYSPETTPEFQPRATLIVAGQQVHPIYVPAVARYAALRTPDGWIIFQL